MRLMTWNVNGRVKHLEAQIDSLAAMRCDVIALQEVRLHTAPIFCHRFRQLGLAYSTHSFKLAPTGREWTGPRRYGELIASRWPIRALPPGKFEIPWPERVLSVVADTPLGKIELHTTHVPPGSSNGWTKIETLEGIYKRLARRSKMPRILCGDFNTPKQETVDGKVITWHKEGTHWDRGERNVLVGLAAFDLVDIYRYKHGYSTSDFSWYARPHIGRRFDHIFASKVLLNGAKCWYEHSLRENGLSDHSALLVKFNSQPRRAWANPAD